MRRHYLLMLLMIYSNYSCSGGTEANETKYIGMFSGGSHLGTNDDSGWVELDIPDNRPFFTGIIHETGTPTSINGSHNITNETIEFSSTNLQRSFTAKKVNGRYEGEYTFSYSNTGSFAAIKKVSDFSLFCGTIRIIGPDGSDDTGRMMLVVGDAVTGVFFATHEEHPYSGLIDGSVSESGEVSMTILGRNSIPEKTDDSLIGQTTPDDPDTGLYVEYSITKSGCQ